MALRLNKRSVPYSALNNHSTANEWKVIEERRRKKNRGKDVYFAEEILAEKKAWEFWNSLD